MIYVLLESEYNIINSFESSIVQKYHKSSVIRVDEFVSPEMEQCLCTPPLFDACWLIICKQKYFGSNLSKLNCSQNVVLIKVTKKGQIGKLIEMIGSHEYRIIDNFRLPPELVKNWIVGQLRCDLGIATYLYNYLGGQLKLITESVHRLSVLPFVTRNLIRQYAEKYNAVSLMDVVQFILGISEKIAYHEVIQWLYEFRYAGKWVKKSVLHELKLYLTVFKFMDVGELTMMNYRDFQKGCKERSVRECNWYRLKKVMEAHTHLSTEMVYYVFLKVSNLGTNALNMRDWLNLVRLGGNNVYRM